MSQRNQITDEKWIGRREVRNLPKSDFCFSKYLIMERKVNIKPAKKLLENIKTSYM